jgi:exodeoxyribonuclease V alpha subunit
VVVDETSMVSLPLMAKLLAALRPAARLVLVGDPLQLASIEAGSVLSDLVGPHRDGPADTDGALAGAITTLTEMHRTEKGSTIPDLAQAIREERLDDVLALLDGSHRDITWVQPHDATALREVRDRVIATSVEVVRAALEDRADDGLRAASKLKVLCATRRGEWGLYAWRDEIEQAVAEAVPSLNRRARWYVGRPIIVTRNDPINHVSNGDVGLVVQRDGSPVVALATGGQPVFLATSRLQQVESWWAMTIHKSQGSEYPETVLSLPTVDSPILTKELIYTGVTRAKNSVTIIASEAMLRTAIARPIARASGLKDRLWPAVM